MMTDKQVFSEVILKRLLNLLEKSAVKDHRTIMNLLEKINADKKSSQQGRDTKN